jgi:Protein of unknown function (DUF3102)
MGKKKKPAGVHAVPKLVKITVELHAIFKRGTADLFQVGRLLTLAKKELAHGEFLPWLEKEFSLSERTAERYMAAHKFWVTVVEPLLKSDKMANLKLRPSAIYELAEMHSRGTVTEADIVAILNEAAKNWVGSERLEEILKSRRPNEAAPEAAGETEPEVADADAEVMTGEPTGMATSAEPVGEATGEAGDGKGEQATEMLPDVAPAPKPKSARSAKDEGNLTDFTASTLNLKRLATHPAKEYVATDVQTADLETVADFLRMVADLKKKQTAATASSAEESAEARKALYAEAEAA